MNLEEIAKPEVLAYLVGPAYLIKGVTYSFLKLASKVAIKEKGLQPNDSKLKPMNTYLKQLRNAFLLPTPLDLIAFGYVFYNTVKKSIRR